jgi:hypothetical protein
MVNLDFCCFFFRLRGDVGLLRFSFSLQNAVLQCSNLSCNTLSLLKYATHIDKKIKYSTTKCCSCDLPSIPAPALFVSQSRDNRPRHNRVPRSGQSSPHHHSYSVEFSDNSSSEPLPSPFFARGHKRGNSKLSTRTTIRISAVAFGLYPDLVQ